ncbi:ATPase [Lachnospiraceae bacterium KM106-2]|nr:ATPase [Lachnospiraceae bacterium KM106-2]
MSTIKHYFPGGNTSKGFVNYFDGIVAPWVVNKRIYVLKGGPGVGKNTFMKLFGKKMFEAGFNLEYFHCASDVNSLDAVHIPEVGVTMLDGTAPHVIDPVTPGAIDGIINLGTYLNEKELAHKSDEILSLSLDNKGYYKSTFAYLAGAGELETNSDYFYMNALDYDELRCEVQDFFGTSELKLGRNRGEMRKLFSEAYTPQGFINYEDSIFDGYKVTLLTGPSIIASEYMKLAIHFALFMGYGCQIFYSALLPDKVKHLVIEDLDLCITTSDTAKDKADQVVDLLSLLDPIKLEKYQDTFEFNELYRKQLVEAGIGSLKKAKKVHDDMELIYREYMDFEGVDVFTQKFVDDFMTDL